MKRRSAAVAFNILAALCSPFALRAQSSERPAPIEFVTPKPPTPVMANGRRLLVYEIHVTNLGAVFAMRPSLERLERHLDLSGSEARLRAGASS